MLFNAEKILMQQSLDFDTSLGHRTRSQQHDWQTFVQREPSGPSGTDQRYHTLQKSTRKAFLTYSTHTHTFPIPGTSIPCTGRGISMLLMLPNLLHSSRTSSIMPVETKKIKNHHQLPLHYPSISLHTYLFIYLLATFDVQTNFSSSRTHPPFSSPRITYVPSYSSSSTRSSSLTMFRRHSMLVAGCTWLGICSPGMLMGLPVPVVVVVGLDISISTPDTVTLAPTLARCTISFLSPKDMPLSPAMAWGGRGGGREEEGGRNS